MSLFLPPRPFWLLGALVGVFGVAVVWPPLLVAGQVGVALLGLGVLADAAWLWRAGGLAARRAVPEKLSMGDDNDVRVDVESTYPRAVRMRVLDEVPVQFQARGAGADVVVPARAGGAPGRAALAYTLRPTARGVYGFGRLWLYASGPLGLVRRRTEAAPGGEAAVYPSLIQMRRYAFLVAQNRLAEAGVRRVRRLGTGAEFDRVRPYAPGDDRRAVNWRATARVPASGGGLALRVNQFEDERAQPVVAALDLGRAMRPAFDGLTLADHAVNASLVLLNTALQTDDRAGLVAFDEAVRVVLPPARGPRALPALLDALYRLDPGFRDPTFEGLHAALGRVERSLVLLFTQIGTVEGLHRRLPALRGIARRHRLVVVLFENTGLRELLDAPPARLSDAYVRAVAEGLDAETREVARTLEQAGIGALVTRPETVTADAVNRYLALRSRGAF